MAHNEIERRSPFRSFLELSVFILALSCLAFSPWFYGLTRFRDQLVSELIVFGLFSISLISQDWKSIFKRGDRQIDFWFYSFLALCLFYVFFSSLPYRSFLVFLRVTSLVLFYFVIRSLVKTERRLQGIMEIIVTAGFFYSVYGLGQYYGFIPHTYWYQPDSLSSRYVNGGHFAAFLLIPMFMGMSLWTASFKNKPLQLILGAVLLTIGWAILLSRTRTVWLSGGVGFLFFLWSLKQNRLLSRQIIASIIVLIAVFFLLLIFQEKFREILGRFQELWDERDVKYYSLIYRWQLWQGAWEAIRENPLGWGLGTFGAVFPIFRVHADRFVVDYAHNEFLQTGVDLGVPGILFLISFLFSFFQRAAKALQNRQFDFSKKVVVSGFVSLAVSLLTASQLDFPLRIHATSLYLAAYLALSASVFGNSVSRSVSDFPHSSLPFQRGRSRRYHSAFFFLVVLGLSFFVTKQLFAQLYFEKGRGLERSFEWDPATQAYEKAIHLVPFYGAYYVALGDLARQRETVSLRRGDKEKFRNKAIRAYQKAAELEPYEASHHYFLALLYERKGEAQRGQAEFLKAISLAPRNAIYLSEYGFFALRNSLISEAIGAFEKYKTIPFKEESRTSLGEILRQCYPAVNDYRLLKRLIGDSPEDHTSLGRLLAEHGEWGLAQKEFDLAVQQADFEKRKGAVLQVIEGFYRSQNRSYEFQKVD